MRIFGGTLGRRRYGEAVRGWVWVVGGVLLVLSGCGRVADGWRRMRGDALRHAGEHARAIAWYERMATNRQDAAVLRHMLSSYEALGMTARVHVVMERLCGLARDARELEALARLRLEREDREGAIGLLERAAGLATNRWRIHAWLIELHLERGATNAAAAVVARAERWLVRTDRNRRRLARAWARVGDMTNAMKYVEELVAANTNDYEARMTLAALQIAAKEYRAALSNVLHVVAAMPQDSEAAGVMADVLNELGEVTDAIRWYRRAIRLHQRNALALNNLAYVLLLHTSNVTEALELARESVRIERTAYALDTLGYAHFLRGEYELALRYVREAEAQRRAKGEAVEPEIELHVGMALAAQGETNEAVRRLGAALRAQPDLERQIRGYEWYEALRGVLTNEVERAREVEGHTTREAKEL